MARNPLKAFWGFVRETASWAQSTLGMGGYNATNPRRKIMPLRRARNATANELSTANLPQLRAWSRQQERNNPMARAAADGDVALLVGHGIALVPDTGDETSDKRLLTYWNEWCEHASTDGRNIFELQQQARRDEFVAGEALWRWVMMDEYAKKGDIPIRLLALESEWLDDLWNSSVVMQPDEHGNVRYGPITMDKYGRPTIYRLRNPETNSMWPLEEVPAEDIIHMYEKRRALQARGEPAMAPVIESLQQDRDLIDTELQSAITCSSIGIAITSELHAGLDTTGDGTASGTATANGDGTTADPAQDLRLGAVARLYPGEEIEAFSHNRPAQGIKDFRGEIRGDIAAATGVPQRFLNRDVSGANYSSMRCDMLDTERMKSPKRDAFGHRSIGAAYKRVFPYLCAKAGLPATTSMRYRLVPDGQPYVDPQKDVDASIAAIRSGLSTFEIEIGKAGGDAKRVLEQLKAELKDPVLKQIFEDGDNKPAQQQKQAEPARSIISRIRAKAKTTANCNDPDAHLYEVKPPEIVVAPVPFMAGASSDGNTVYIDPRCPKTLDINGKTIDVHKLMVVHEYDEWRAMVLMSHNYATSHMDAEALEHLILATHYGLTPEEIEQYERALKPIEEACMADPQGVPPADIYIGPYLYSGRLDLLQGQGEGGDPSGAPTAEGNGSGSVDGAADGN